jgi:FdhE protein
MIPNLAVTSSQVRKAVQAVIKRKPLYAEMLEFYGQIFEAQEESKCRIQIEPMQIPQEMLSVKAREKFPLIETREFVFDENEAEKLFFTICKLSKEANTKMAASARTILSAVERTLRLKELFLGLLAGNEALFENIAVELEIDKPVLGFITYNSLAPSLFTCADHLSIHLNKDTPWLRGYCPICGSAPLLSILAEEGSRRLVCSFCGYKWSAKRVYCPFCDCSDGKKLHYFYNEEERDFRVDVCDNCKKYIKTVDARKAGRLLYPTLEQISTLHLDIKANEMGFETGIRLFMHVSS